MLVVGSLFFVIRAAGSLSREPYEKTLCDPRTSSHEASSQWPLSEDLAVCCSHLWPGSLLSYTDGYIPSSYPHIGENTSRCQPGWTWHRFQGSSMDNWTTWSSNTIREHKAKAVSQGDHVKILALLLTFGLVLSLLWTSGSSSETRD